jgi:uncharacterized protein
MDRVFLDANVLFAAAWRSDAALQRLWELDNAELLSSKYAIEEARRNLETPAQQGRLTRLLRKVRRVEAEHFTLPRNVRLPEKDMPILLAAIDGGATHLLTGDRPEKVSGTDDSPGRGQGVMGSGDTMPNSVR